MEISMKLVHSLKKAQKFLNSPSLANGYGALGVAGYGNVEKLFWSDRCGAVGCCEITVLVGIVFGYGYPG